MRVALVNPPWSFENSIYFGCREPHLPLELGYSKALLEAAGHEVLMLDGAPLRHCRRDALAEAVAAFAPDMTVVTTAPTYLFWRCAQPELRVPREFLAALGGRGGRTVAVGPHGSATPETGAAQARRRRRGARRMRGGGARARRGRRRPARGALHRLPRRRRRSASPAAPPPRASSILPALRWPDEWIARHRHHHHRFDSGAGRPGRRGRGLARLPLHLHLLRQDRLPRRLPPPRARPGARGDRRADRAGRRPTSTSSTRSSCRSARCWRRWSVAAGPVRRADADRPLEAGHARPARRRRLRLDRGRRREPDARKAAPRSTSAAALRPTSWRSG